MTFTEAMQAARKEADNATATAKAQGMTFPDAYAVGYLTAALALAWTDLAAAKATATQQEARQ
jgi:hypothetical protein